MHENSMLDDFAEWIDLLILLDLFDPLFDLLDPVWAPGGHQILDRLIAFRVAPSVL